MSTNMARQGQKMLVLHLLRKLQVEVLQVSIAPLSKDEGEILTILFYTIIWNSEVCFPS